MERDRSVMIFILCKNAYIGRELVKEKIAVKLTEGDHVEISASDKKSQALFISSKILE